MPSFALASCQIIPHDIDIDGLVIAVIIAAWLIGKRR